MQLLIDGYNVLKKIKGSHISERERENFIKKLTAYANHKQLTIFLIFDGGPFQWPTQNKIGKYVWVVYSGVRESADDYIKYHIEHKDSNDMLLITSDRELIQFARARSIASLDSYDFLHFLDTMQQPSQKKEASFKKAEKLVRNDNVELDALMERLTVPTKHEIDDSRKTKKKEQLSKEERKLLQKIKKL